MQRSDFHYHLPEELIAQQPLARRADSRLLQLERQGGQCHDRLMRELPDLLASGDLLVFNDTRVIPARLFGRKPSGGRVEIMLERVLGEDQALAMLRASKSLPEGTEILLDDGAVLRITGREGAFFHLQLEGASSLQAVLEQQGHMPLPPYIRREDAEADRERYQTVYARTPGAVAAPTAGLHFSESLLASLAERGIGQAWVTLHVGAGTFQPVRADDIRDHQMHAEWLSVGQETVEAVARTRAQGGRIIAVGTTAVRSLETAAQDGELQPYEGDSRLFIYPGYPFRVVDGMVTNFHLPESTLLMLVSAFAGREAVLAAYRHAVSERYRFFSYGDAMLLL